MQLSRIIRKAKSCLDIFPANAKVSYSQFGEDILIEYFFSQILENTKPVYLDIGANKPKNGSNTYAFYLRKCYGVCVEPDITLYNNFKKARPHDKVLNVGIGLSESGKKIPFYYFPEPYTGWNTFSEQDALQKQLQTGIRFKNDIEIELKNINTIIEENFGSNNPPNFISIDVEGLELDILHSLNFKKYSPELFCLETMRFDNNKLGQKNTVLINFMIEKGYAVYADTYVNTLFIKNEYISK
jgi:FkbM family methyltransferase